MWPFKTEKMRLKEVEEALRQCEAMLALQDERLKRAEREVDDLHFRYRRIRATQAGDARAASAGDNGQLELQHVPETPKEALRAKVFGGIGKVVPK